jgi:hypothetical protein
VKRVEESERREWKRVSDVSKRECTRREQD